MKKIKSSKSLYVKISTTIFIMMYPVIFLGVLNKYGLIEALSLIAIMIIIITYFYGNSLNYIMKTDSDIILKKGFTKIVIPHNNIKEILPLKSDFIKVTFGSKGVFGFNGIAMESENCLINDLNKIVLIKTTEKDYLISCDDVNALK